MDLFLLPSSRPGQVAAQLVAIPDALFGGGGSAFSFDATPVGGCTS